MRVVRIFLSTPSDVGVERTQVQHLVRDVNETLQFLDPTRELRVEVVFHETHAFPDVGAPQAVIDRQLPVDYEIYLGVMWKRAGTPTGMAESGTIHEFELAYAHAVEHGWPTVMFFFCDDQIQMPRNDDDVDQLRRVVEFRRRVDSMGYTASYSDRNTFRDALRPRLLRAIADVLATGNTAPSGRNVDPRFVSRAQHARIRALAEQYNEIRRTMRSGNARTFRMTQIYNDMVELASDVRPLLGDLLASQSEGERLAAIAVLRAFPSADHLTWLAERIDVEKPFAGYQAAVALSQAADTLGREHEGEVLRALHRAMEPEGKLPSDSDRFEVLRRALDKLQRRARRRPEGDDRPRADRV